MTCVFWKEGASKQHWGVWSPEGCRTEQPSPSQVLCRCNHLSYFAVLMVRVPPAWGRGPELLGPEQGAKAGARDTKPNSSGLRERKEDTQRLMFLG